MLEDRAEAPLGGGGQTVRLRVGGAGAHSHGEPYNVSSQPNLPHVNDHDQVRTIISPRGEEFKKNLTIAQATNARDAIAKAIYEACYPPSSMNY